MSCGTRPLTNDEIASIKAYFDTTFDDPNDCKLRNYTIFMTQAYLGWRIAEILSLNVGDVYVDGNILPEAYLKKANSKGKTQGRRGRINEALKDILLKFINHYHFDFAGKKDEPLFIASTNRGRLTTRQASKIYDKVFAACKIDGNVSTHSLRKSFAKKIYDSVGGNLIELQAAMGHKSISSTQHYIAANSDKIKSALDDLKF